MAMLNNKMVYVFLTFSLHSKVFEFKVVVSKPHFMGDRCQVLLKLLISWLYETSHETTPTQLTASLGNLWLSKFTQDSAIQSATGSPTWLFYTYQAAWKKQTNKQLTEWAVANPTGPKLPELLGSRSSPGDWIRWVSIHLKSSQLSKNITQIFLNSFEVLQKQSRNLRFSQTFRWLRVKTLAPFRVA